MDRITNTRSGSSNKNNELRTCSHHQYISPGKTVIKHPVALTVTAILNKRMLLMTKNVNQHSRLCSTMYCLVRTYSIDL